MSIPVLLTEMPGVQMDLIRGIAADAGDIDCNDCDDRSMLDDAIAATGAVVVITGADALDLPPEYGELLYGHPRVRVLAIGADGRRSAVHELRPYRTPIGEISPRELVDAIRRAPGAREVHE